MLDTGEWDRLIIPAIATDAQRYSTGPHTFYDRAAGEVLHAEREPREALDEMRRAMGSMHYAAQYMQNPVPPDGNLVHRDWLRFYRTEPEAFDVLVATWDTAYTVNATSDYSVGMLWGALGTDYYLLDLVRGRFEYPDLRRKVIDCHNEWQPDATLVEDANLGRGLCQDLLRTEGIRILPRKPRGEKEARLSPHLARFEAGQVHLPQNESWLSCYVEELLAFPFGKHDDQVDATSQALQYFMSLMARKGPLVRRNIKRQSVVRRNRG